MNVVVVKNVSIVSIVQSNSEKFNDLNAPNVLS
jgi:hypothetical protein